VAQAVRTMKRGIGIGLALGGQPLYWSGEVASCFASVRVREVTPMAGARS